MTDQDRIVQAVENAVRAHDRLGTTRARVLKLVREERARAWDEAAAACDEALADEMKTLRSVGYIDASVRLRETFRALAAQERAK